jgi:hypothetical protein
MSVRESLGILFDERDRFQEIPDSFLKSTRSSRFQTPPGNARDCQEPSLYVLVLRGNGPAGEDGGRYDNNRCGCFGQNTAPGQEPWHFGHAQSFSVSETR